MCKKLGAYPNCQCPGFNGEPASSDDTRGCYTSYCQDPSAPCPNDAFVNCVKENTAAFLQQMKATTFGADCEGTRGCYTSYCQDPSAP